MTSVTETPSFDLSQLNATSTASQAAKLTQLTQADFLKIMTEQMKAQDPMNPQSNSEFVSQMAQFGTVNGIQQLQQSFSALSNSLQSNQALQASALVGRRVQVNSSIAGLSAATNSMTGSINVPQDVNDLQLVIKDGQGQVVKQMSLGSNKQGLTSFTWNGLGDDGKQRPPGDYQISATATINGQAMGLSTLASFNVDSVTVSPTQGVLLNAGAAGTVPLSAVQKIG